MKYFYYEPKTGFTYDREPRERNVYRLKDTAENRKKLGELSGYAKLAWLEQEDGNRRWAKDLQKKA
jgi:hypothetical protein